MLRAICKSRKVNVVLPYIVTLLTGNLKSWVYMHVFHVFSRVDSLDINYYKREMKSGPYPGYAETGLRNFLPLPLICTLTLALF